MILYLDTSALVKLYVKKLGSQAVRALLERARVVSEKAHLYVTPQGIDALVTRARHTEITSFFITNTPTALPEGVLRAADNLFIFRLPLEEDIKWVAKSGMIEESSLFVLVEALPQHACLALGEISGGYPLILGPDPVLGCETRGKTRYYF
jgi:predicted nucleic acid-binding protein